MTTGQNKVALTRLDYCAPHPEHNTCSEEEGGNIHKVKGLEVVRMAELVDQSLTPLRLLHDSLLVVLSQGPGQLVVVHGWTVLITNILL